MESIHLPAVPRLSSTATQNTQNAMRIRKVQSGWNRRKGILPMILPTIRKSCTVNWSLFLSTSIRESRTTCYRKEKDKLLGFFSLRKVAELSNVGSGGTDFKKTRQQGILHKLTAHWKSFLRHCLYSQRACGLKSDFLKPLLLLL